MLFSISNLDSPSKLVTNRKYFFPLVSILKADQDFGNPTGYSEKPYLVIIALCLINGNIYKQADLELT